MHIEKNIHKQEHLLLREIKTQCHDSQSKMNSIALYRQSCVAYTHAQSKE